MEIKKSEFVISNATWTMCPKDSKPEYAFIGRSNVGKSSLINMLCNHKNLAKTSSTPGKTLFINWLGRSGVPFSIVFTKADKLGPVKAKQSVETYMATLTETWEELPPYFITSSEKKTGRDEVLDYIDKINKTLKDNA